MESQSLAIIKVMQTASFKDFLRVHAARGEEDVLWKLSIKSALKNTFIIAYKTKCACELCGFIFNYLFF